MFIQNGRCIHRTNISFINSGKMEEFVFIHICCPCFKVFVIIGTDSLITDPEPVIEKMVLQISDDFCPDRSPYFRNQLIDIIFSQEHLFFLRRIFTCSRNDPPGAVVRNRIKSFLIFLISGNKKTSGLHIDSNAVLVKYVLGQRLCQCLAELF